MKTKVSGRGKQIMRMMKREIEVTRKFISNRSKKATDAGFSVPKYIEFCKYYFENSFGVRIYEARKTFSKYVYIGDGNKTFKVRFSNHKPNKGKELDGDCDFFVGVTHTGVRTTKDATIAANKFFGLA